MVVDPLSLTAIGAVTLTEAIKFLYGQAAELLRRCQERRALNAAENSSENVENSNDTTSEPPPASDPGGVLDGELSPNVDESRLDDQEPRLRELRLRLTEYVERIKPVSPDDEGLMVSAAQLRAQLELILGQRVSFRGEQRAATGTPLDAPVVAATEQALTVVTAVGAASIAIGRDNTGSATTHSGTAPPPNGP